MNSDDRFKRKLEITTNCLKNVIKEFLRNPCDFLYEEDIRGLLYTRLRDSFMENKLLLRPYKDEFNASIWREDIEINPVKAEYAPERGKSYYIVNFGISYIDVVILSDLDAIDRSNYHRPADIIIELNYSTNYPDEKQGPFFDDFNKISSYKNRKQPHYTGIAICFDLHPILSIEDLNRSYASKKISFRNISLDTLKLNQDYTYAMYIGSKRENESSHYDILLHEEPWKNSK